MQNSIIGRKEEIALLEKYADSIHATVVMDDLFSH